MTDDVSTPDGGEDAPAVVWLDVAPDKLRTWTLVLDAEGIPYRVVRHLEGLSLAIPRDRAERALRELSAYEHENPPEPEAPPTAPAAAAGYTALAVVLALGAFFFVTGPRDAGAHWFAVGSTHAARLLGGEPWRAVTALTLHADVPHVLANMVAGGLFFALVFRTVGPGLGLSLVLASGVVGNAINALAHQSGHSAVGASTAVFGAVGVLAGLQAVRERALPGRPGSWWLPIGAGIALLAMLGTGSEANVDVDVMGHVFGLLAGLGVGALAGSFVDEPPPIAAQAALGLGALVLVVGSWWKALGVG